MLVMKGGSTSIGGRDFAITAPAIADRPWAANGSMAVDALLVWALAVQRAAANPVEGLFEQEIAAAGYSSFRTSADGCAAVERIGSAGCRIDMSPVGRTRVSEVAEQVLIAAQATDDGEMLIDWARLGSAPDGWATPPRWAWPRYGWKIEGVEAEPVYDYAGPGRSGASVAVVIVSRAQVEAFRGRYRAWWAGLEELAWRLGSRALGFVVSPPAAPREPWIEIGGGVAANAA